MALASDLESVYELLVDDYHAARELVDTLGGPTGRWFYCCHLNGRLWPIGYCTPDCRHPTREEAEEHYRQYLLGQAVYDGRWQGVEYRCEVCGQWTDRFAQLKSFVLHRLCPAHLNREGLASVLAGT